MRQLVLSCSLSPKSRSAVMAQRLASELQRLGDEARLIDLRRFAVPFCDGDACYRDANVVELQKTIQEAATVTIATPVYNYAASAAARNLVALSGKAWTGKVVGFLCAAGGAGSYMAVMGLANSLMLDFRCMVVPRFVYATGASFKADALADPEVEKRIAELAVELRRVASALSASLS